jgi:hypothetical protein
MLYFLSLIPEEPSYIPRADAQSRALDAIRAFLKKKVLFQKRVIRRRDEAEVVVEVEVSDDIQFVHPGVNLESVSCPACDTRLDIETWNEWMDKSCDSKFVDRSITTPCCGCETELNALQYDGPAGFARCILHVVNLDIENGLLPPDKLSVLEEILGCKLRQIGMHLWSGIRQHLKRSQKNEGTPHQRHRARDRRGRAGRPVPRRGSGAPSGG